MTKEQIAAFRRRAAVTSVARAEDVEALCDEVERLRAEVERLSEEAAEATAVLEEIEGYSNCSDLGADIIFDARREVQRRAREQAEAEAKKKRGAS